MTYRVIGTARLWSAAQEQAAWWAENRSAEQANRWLAAMTRALRTLERSPERHARPREHADLALDLRQLNFGLGRRATHRILYEIRDTMVYAVTVRSLHQDDITASDL